MARESKQIGPVIVTHTTNPEDRAALVDAKLRIVISEKGIALLDEDGRLRREYVWNALLRAAPYPLTQPPHLDFEELQWPRCDSCKGYAAHSEVACNRCVLLALKDPLGIYEAFELGLSFSDRYYREAFLKWATEFGEEGEEVSDSHLPQ